MGRKIIYTPPPDDGFDTDVDSDKLDDEHEGNLNNLGRNMLLSKYELFYRPPLSCVRKKFVKNLWLEMKLLIMERFL